jgi:hypothetical protein
MGEDGTSPRRGPSDDHAAWQVIGVHSRGFDLAASVVAIAVAVAAGYALLRPDDDVTGRSRTGTVVATLEHVESRVRVKGNAMPVWDEASGAQSLHNSDQVFTDASSSAVLRFSDEGTVELGERTLIAVERPTAAERPILNVLSGSLRAQAAPGAATLVRVSRDIVVAAAAGTEFTVESTPDGAAVHVTKGDLEIRSEAGTTRLDPTKTASISNAGAVATAKVVAYLDAPTHGHQLGAGGAVDLEWRLGADVETLRLEVSRDPTFSQVVTQVTTAGTSHRLADLADGTYYWRLSVEGDASRQSEVRRFDVKTRATLRVTWPTDGHVFPMPLGDQPTDILLAWSPQTEAGTDVAVMRGGTQFLQRHVSGTSLRASLPAGEYVMSVTRGEETATIRFSITPPVTIEPPTPAPPLPPPVLQKRYEIEAPDGDDTGWLRFFSDVAYADEHGGSAISWDPVAGAFGYRVEISNDEDGRDVVWRQDTPDSSATPKLRAGRYYLRVATLDAAGLPGPFSPASELVVTARRDLDGARHPERSEGSLIAPQLIAPEQDARLPATVDPLPLTLKWDAVKGAAHYEVEVLTDKTTAYTRRTRGTDATAPLPPGSYAWRARSLAPGGAPGPWSKSVTFSVTAPAADVAAPIPPPPVEVTPIDKTQLAAPDTYFGWAYAPSAWQLVQTGAASTKVRASLFNIQQARAGVRLNGDWSLSLRGERLATNLVGEKLVLTNGHGLIRYAFGDAWRFTSGLGYGWREQNVFAPLGARDVALQRSTLSGPVAGIELAWRTPRALPVAIGAHALVASKDKQGRVKRAVTWTASIQSHWQTVDWLWINAGVDHSVTDADLAESGATLGERLTSLTLGLTLTP